MNDVDKYKLLKLHKANVPVYYTTADGDACLITSISKIPVDASGSANTQYLAHMDESFVVLDNVRFESFTVQYSIDDGLKNFEHLVMLKGLINEASKFFSPLHNFDGEKDEWLDRANSKEGRFTKEEYIEGVKKSMLTMLKDGESCDAPDCLNQSPCHRCGRIRGIR